MKMRPVFEKIKAEYDYALDLWELIGSDAKLKNGWKVSQDMHSGAITVKKGKTTFGATPWWDDGDDLGVVELTKDGDENLITTLPFETTDDKEQDLKNWENAMNTFLAKQK